MERVTIKETNLNILNPSERYSTNCIVIHHIGNENGVDTDNSAEEINRWHKNQGYAGIGYHFVIRKNGTIERGRPVWALGAHAYGENWHSIGILLSGTYIGNNQPTAAQIESAAMLIANLCADYSISTTRANIVGHCDLMSTDCPGKNLYAKLDEIIGKANWYRYGAVKPNVLDKPSIYQDEMLSAHFSASEFWCKGQDQKTCHCNHSLKIRQELINLLEELRKLCGNRPLYINSGYRCKEHNAAIDGVPNSQHCLGTAADVARPEGMTFNEFKSCVEKLPFDGIGIYRENDFIHVDIREGGVGAGYRW